MGSTYEGFERAGGREGLAERLTWRGLGRGSTAGTVGGLLAGACMMAFAVLYFGATGRGYGLPPKLMAATFLGVDALIGGTAATIVGLAIHAFFSVLWSVLFASLISRRTHIAAALGWGLTYGFFVWAAMTWLVLPWANPTLYGRFRLFGNAWLVAHLIYGIASFAIVPLLRLFPRTGEGPRGD
jgi:hypothetical protein